MKVLAADFGGGGIKIGLLEQGALLATAYHRTAPGARLADHLADLKKGFRRLLDEAGAVGESACGGMAWALPCVIAPDRRTIVKSFGKWDDVATLDLAQWAEEEMGLPLTIDNDARAALVGEAHDGAGRSFANLMMITLGTGIGTAMMIGGEPLYGATGMAGNLGGHTITHAAAVAADRVDCPCGLRGCLEAQIGGWRLPALARAQPGFAASSLAGGEAKLDYRTVFEHAAAGDAVAEALKNAALEGWSILLLNSVRQFDPQCIVIGGGVAQAGEAVLAPLRETLQRSGSSVELRVSELGDAAALVGGAWLAERMNLKRK